MSRDKFMEDLNKLLNLCEAQGRQHKIIIVVNLGAGGKVNSYKKVTLHEETVNP